MVEKPYIVVVNKCNEKIYIDSIEVKYYITFHIRSKRDDLMEEKPVRREIVERISVGEEVLPQASIRLYFGAVENVESIAAIVRRDSRLLKVDVNLARS